MVYIQSRVMMVLKAGAWRRMCEYHLVLVIALMDIAPLMTPGTGAVLGHGNNVAFYAFVAPGDTICFLEQACSYLLFLAVLRPPCSFAAWNLLPSSKADSCPPRHVRSVYSEVVPGSRILSSTVVSTHSCNPGLGTEVPIASKE